MFDRDGLYLEVSPRGGKWWRLKYRYAGKEKRGARSERTRLQPDGTSGGAPENDAGLGGLPGQAQERRRTPFATFAASCDRRRERNRDLLHVTPT
jgi:hypothetical protein